jgi:hypothetical protein
MNLIKLLLYFIVFIISCNNSNKNSDKKYLKSNVNEGWKEHNPMPDVSLHLPNNWHAYEGQLGAYVEDCDKEFCTNLVCYSMEDDGARTILNLRRLFLKAMKLRSSKFELVSAIERHDCITISYYYTHVDYNYELFGRTKIWIKNNHVFVFQISGLRNDSEVISINADKIFETVNFR